MHPPRAYMESLPWEGLPADMAATDDKISVCENSTQYLISGPIHSTRKMPWIGIRSISALKFSEGDSGSLADGNSENECRRAREADEALSGTLRQHLAGRRL